jgi:hypothetical protein
MRVEPEKRPSFVQVFEELEKIGRSVSLDVMTDEKGADKGKEEEQIYNDSTDIELQVYN